MSEFDFTDEALARKARGEPQPEAEADRMDPVQERPRDQQGRFTSEPEPEPQVEGEPEGELILGKFRSYEELERGYSELESGYGRLGQEVGELRRVVEESFTEDEPEPQYYGLSDDQLGSMVEQYGYAQTAEWARQNAPQHFRQVMREWYDDDPFDATEYHASRIAVSYDQRLAQEVGPAVQGYSQNRQEVEFAQAWTNVQQAHPDLNDLANDVLAVSEHAPELADALVNGDNQQVKQRALENLLHIARATRSSAGESFVGGPASDPSQVAREQIQEKLDARVATGSSAPTQGGKTNIDVFKDRMLQQTLSVETGLTRPS